uniref:C3a anaphylatoxin chemotactic receptor n=1 Tax=Danio rerio TaxID=7955 RepID=C3AR_DANRE|nr:RecName: Full=C3a anaphylatoxin chemotactic receptor; Short=C3AR; Short=C3a-R [Danio rerio]
MQQETQAPPLLLLYARSISKTNYIFRVSAMDENYENFTDAYEEMWGFDANETNTFASSEVRVISLVVYCLTFLLGVPGNSFVIFIAGMKMKRTVNTIWFLNLATADLLCCLSVPLTVAEILLDHHWPYGYAMCKILPSVIVISMFASVFTLNIISLDRFTQVITPVWAQNHRSLLLARLSCVAVWILALLLSLPFMILRRTYEEFNMTVCTFDDDDFTTYGALSIVRFVFGFLIPLMSIVTCYGIIARKLGSRHFRSGRAFRIMLAVIVAFFLCWMPYHVLDLIRSYGGESSSMVALKVDPLAISLAYVNSCLNPVLYVFMGQDFKNKVQLSLRRVFERAFSEEGTQISRSTQSQQVHSVL